MTRRAANLNLEPAGRRRRRFASAGRGGAWLGLILLAWMLVGPPTAATAAETPAAPRLPPRDLATHASPKRYWVSQVLPRAAAAAEGAGPTRSAVRVREAAGAAQPWERVIVVQGRVVDLAHRADNAVLLLEDGTWLIAWNGGSSTGPSLPDGGVLRAIGADDASLWAVGVEPARAPSATSPAVERTAPPDANAATADVPADAAGGAGTLRAYRFSPSEAVWLRRLPPLPLPLPATASADVAVSLAVESDRPAVAVLQSARRLLVFRAAAVGDGWDPPEIVEADFDVRAFQLLGGTPSLTLWLAGPTGPGELRLRREGAWLPPVPLAAAEADLASAVARTAEYFAGFVRLVWIADPAAAAASDGQSARSASAAARLRERAFTLDGQPASDAVDLGRTPPPRAEPIGSGTLVLLGVLAALLAMNVLRAEEDQALSFGAQTVRLAPLPRRLVAGLIDLFPVVATAAWLIPLTDGAAAAEMLQGETFTVWMLGAMGVYLAHTTLAELATGRSVGKLATGLRVVSVATGGRATAGAVLLRNVFRAIDVFPGLPLVVLILFSPLRQRLGDVVAGTVVIADRAAPVGPIPADQTPAEPQA